jgi:tetratricopeptide (TPR) repeat protein
MTERAEIQQYGIGNPSRPAGGNRPQRRALIGEYIVRAVTNGLGMLAATTMCLLEAGVVLGSEPNDCGHPVAQRSIPACTLLIDRGDALPGKRAELLLFRGTAYLINGDNDQAIKDLDESIRLHPRDADAFLSRGDAYYSKGDYQRALAEYDEASWIEPDHLGAYFARGDVYRKLGQAERGEGDAMFDRELAAGSAVTRRRDQKYWQQVAERFKLLDEAIRQNPSEPRAYFNRASTYRSLGKWQYDRALSDYDQVIRLEPAHVKAYYGRAFIHDRRGEYELAIADTSQVMRLEPKDEKALINRARIYEHKGDYMRAIADYSEAFRVASTTTVRFDSRLYPLRGLAYERNGERDKAIADYRKVLSLNSLPDANIPFPTIAQSVEGLKRLGADLSEFPQFDDTQEVARLTELIQRYPTNDNHYRHRCSAHLKKGDYDIAIADCTQAIRLNSPNRSLPTYSLAVLGLADTYNKRGTAYRNKADWDRALQDSDQAISLMPSIADYYHHRGLLFTEWSNYDRAIEDCTQAIRQNPKVDGYYDCRGTAYERKGEREKANANFDKARQIRASKPNDPLLVPP